MMTKAPMATLRHQLAELGSWYLVTFRKSASICLMCCGEDRLLTGSLDRG